MYYYEVAILNNPLAPFTYCFEEELSLYTKVDVNLNRKLQTGYIVKTCQKPTFKTLPIVKVTAFSLPKSYFEIAQFISTYYVCSLGEALSVFTPFKHEQKALEKMELSTDIELSSEQNRAISFIEQNQTTLLFADTGAGKTEIYMKLFEQMLQAGKSCIFLMPEISLTPQMSKRLKKNFGDMVEVWHSKLTKKKKESILEGIYEGSIKIVAGPRSTLFLPLKNLGAIIVDEEHDDSYKANQKPRLHARDLAVFIGQKLGAKVVLGSATPSVTSYEKFPFVRLKGSFFKQDKNYIFEQGVEELSASVLELIEQTKTKEEQAILFLPTRANYKYLICNSCGFTYKCPHCSVGMSMYKHNFSLKCHYCGFTQDIPEICPKCNEGSLQVHRLGTAEAVNFFHANLKHIRTEQFDKDSVNTQTKLKKVIKAFNDKEIDLLVGTQMLSKGHDYADVTLSVILGIDNILNLSDYRARERALSLLLQVAGRSGRQKAAKVLIQSHQRDFFEHYLHDYEEFILDERYFRQEAYPPFKKLARILFSHKNYNKAREQLELTLKKLAAFKEVEVVGYGNCAIEVIAQKYRLQILLRAGKATELLRALHYVNEEFTTIDMDPIEFS